MIKPLSIPRNSLLKSKYLLIAALIQKQLAVQSYKSELGLVWVLMEPISQALVFGFFMGVLLKARTVPDIPFLFFLLIGFQMLNIFNDAMSSGMTAIGKGRQYMSYYTVGTMDVFLSNILYDFLTNIFATIVFVIAAIWWGVEVSLGSLHILFFCYIIVWLLGSACGLSLGTLTQRSTVAKKIVSIARRPLLMVSCVFSPFAWLSPFLAEYFYWNPIAHCIEWARKSLFPHYHVADLNLAYPTAITVIAMATGIGIYFRHRHNI
jgi:capsular polysaccharide transport system permease protein